jgi:sodium-dependent dicarboxylate transporter 2/3/5
MKEQVLKITFAFVVGIAAYFLGHLFFNSIQSELLGIIAFLVALWTNEAVPLGVVSLMPIVLFPAFGIINTKATTLNYAHPIIYLFLGGFLLAIAVEKTKLHIHIAHKLLSFFPSTPRGMIFSVAITSGLLSSILSNTTTTLLLYPLPYF